MTEDWTIEPEPPKRKPGRPPGSKNKTQPVAIPPLTPVVSAPVVTADDDLRGASDELRALPLPRHRAFVRALVTYGCNHTQAAKIAGYTGSDAVLRSSAYRLAHDPKILKALTAESERRLTSSAAIAVKVLSEFAEAEWIDPKLRLKAACEILDRAEANLSRRSEKKLIIDDRRTDTPERINNIIGMAQTLGIDPRQLLGSLSITLDADYKVIEAPHLTAMVLEDQRAVPDDE